VERSTVSDLLLLLGATMRLTRLITSDDLGRWWIKDPLDALFHPRDEMVQDEPGSYTLSRGTAAPRLIKGHRYLAGLSCPHCAGTWVGYGVLASYVATAKSRRARAAWRFVAGGLALNTAAVTIGRELDYWEE